MKMKCEQVRWQLPAYVDRDLHSVGDIELHLAGCADCTRELGEYREMLAGLAAMRADDFAPSPEFLDRILELVPVSVGDRARKMRLALASVGGAAVGATALAILWWKLSHREGAAEADSPVIA